MKKQSKISLAFSTSLILGALSILVGAFGLGFSFAKVKTARNETQLLYRAAPVTAVVGIDGWRVTVVGNVACRTAASHVAALERALSATRASASAALASYTYQVKLPPDFGPGNSVPFEMELIRHLPTLPEGASYEGDAHVDWYREIK